VFAKPPTFRPPRSASGGLAKREPFNLVLPNENFHSQETEATVKSKTWIAIGCALASMSVVMGAFGAHLLEDWLQENWADDWQKRLENWKTAATYQMYHSLGLIAVGFICFFTSRRKSAAMAGVTMILGTVLFSGMLYGWVLTDKTTMVMIVPIGGSLMIVSWLLLAWAALGSFRSARIVSSQSTD
jgi:uncharacterized membrane protein YgdD (TMEM256/DUF423 family)